MTATDHLSPHQFDVEVSTHDLLKKGVTAASLPGDNGLTHHRVIISADYSHAEAQIIAAQMRAITAHSFNITKDTSVMPTATHARI